MRHVANVQLDINARTHNKYRDYMTCKMLQVPFPPTATISKRLIEGPNRLKTITLAEIMFGDMRWVALRIRQDVCRDITTIIRPSKPDQGIGGDMAMLLDFNLKPLSVLFRGGIKGSFELNTEVARPSETR
ncbi:hypothetical protein BT63DRAFT_413990 [Microthyrium microscopicum]|uniref:Uncharacterized protein n=1 Tax=Microthyrium microscopicum TaxID=703497 RepID=A0A6A6UBE9_9PEZI|nr:hypothetical protein BT63DRAFT_413990 [Microthyrium microscopicum]